MSQRAQFTESVSVGIGVVLVLLGALAYILSDFASVTALIPAVFGILIVALARTAQSGQNRQRALYAIGALALLGILGSLRVIPDLLDQTWNVGTVSQGGMIVLSLVLLVVVANDILGE